MHNKFWAMLDKLIEVEWGDEAFIADHAKRILGNMDADKDVAFQDLFWALVNHDYERVMSALDGHTNENQTPLPVPKDFPDHLAPQVIAPFGVQAVSLLEPSNQNKSVNFG